MCRNRTSKLNAFPSVCTAFPNTHYPVKAGNFLLNVCADVGHSGCAVGGQGCEGDQLPRLWWEHTSQGKTNIYPFFSNDVQFFSPQYPYIYIYLFYRRSLYLSFMWEIRSLACLELRGWSKSSPLNYLGWRDVDSVPSWAHWAWVLIFGQVKAIYVLFHQLADVYCPQTILHLIHNAGWGSSAQVRLYMRDNPFFCETPSCCLCTV